MRIVALALAGLAFAAAALGSPPRLTSKGIGPLRLGMTQAAALRTGWLAHRGTGCPLGGRPYPVTYRVRGRRAPRGVGGTVEFVAGRLRDMSFNSGVTTSEGIRVGHATLAAMALRYRRAGDALAVRHDNVFQGTFVTVSSHGRALLEGFGSHGTVEMISVPLTPVCD